MDSAPFHGRTLHLIGIGGAGMSGLALVSQALGASVGGSDRADSPYCGPLRAAGIEPRVGHDAANLPDGAEVIVSTAIAEDNSELAAARAAGLRVLHRGELLGEITRLRPSIAVAGTHGKTTTASMIAHVLRECGRDPGFLIGGELRSAGVNAGWGGGEWVVVEADESDRSFLQLGRDVAVVTNVELDHHATYRSLAELEEAFHEFLAPARRRWLSEQARGALGGTDASIYGIDGLDGTRVAGENVVEGGVDAAPAGAGEQAVEGGADAAPAGAVASAAGGASAGAPLDLRAERPDLRAERPDLRAERLELLAGGSRFTVDGVTVELRVPGRHNVLNALAALAACREAGVEIAEAAPALTSFIGAGRRFEEHGRTATGALVVDDYAHHPTEVRATLEAARTLEPRRLVACFQPHLYSRTRMLAREFGQALALADLVVVLDVYPARERAEDFPGVGGLLVAQAAADAAQGRPVWWLPRIEDAQQLLEDELQEGDLALTLGAGDVDQLARALAGEARR